MTRWGSWSILLCGLVLFHLVSGTLAESADGQEAGQDASGVRSRDASVPRTAALTSNLNRRAASSLWDGRIAVVPETEQQKRDRQELQKLIERINSFNVSSKKRTTAPTGVDTAESPAQSEETAQNEAEPVDAKAPTPASPEDADPPQAGKKSGGLSAEILSKVMKLSDRPEALMDPFAIAEVLYASGHLPEAAQFYEKALERINQANGPDPEKRAWIIFQTGNCLRGHQPAQAVHLYKMLIREYPDSPWKEAAQTWLTLSEWYSKEKPAELIRECEQLRLSVNQVLSELDS